MKLRNKLIPFASVFATVATLAPVSLTSCGSKNGMVNLTDGNYVPTTKKAVTEGYVASEELATELWMSEVNDKPQTLIDDMLWYNAINLKGWGDINGMNVTSVKGLVKNASVKYVTVKIDGVDTKIPTVSMTYSFSLECNWYTNGRMVSNTVSHDVLYSPWVNYCYDSDVAGKITSSIVYESTWENIPVQLFDRDAKYKEISAREERDVLPPTIHTEWFFKPVTSRLLLMDNALIGWNYSVKYAHSDTFAYQQDGKERVKNYASTLDRKYNNYFDLWSGPTETAIGKRKILDTGLRLLESETFGSYYLSDLKKPA